MISIILALLAAVGFSLSAILVGGRLDESNFFSVSCVVTFIGNIILWPLALLLTNLRAVSLEGVLFFGIAGILSPGIARLLAYKGMEAVGVSVNATIFSTYPMYSSILAVLLLGERLPPRNLFGIVCVIFGVVFIERNLGKPDTGPKITSKKGVVFPLLGALTVAFAFILRKHGLNIYNEPLLGAAMGYSLSALLYLLLSLAFSHTMRASLFFGKNFRLFGGAGVCMSLAWLSGFYALSHERVSIVTSIIQTQPLFVLFFAYLFLKKSENISFKLIIGTLLIVIGAILVST